MCRHKCCAYVHGMLIVHLSDDPEHFELGLKIQAVAALGFAGSDSQAHHLIEKALGLYAQFVKSSLPGLAHRIHDAASCPENVKISGTFEF